MSAITIKNIPEELYNKLKEAAYINRRSINSELIYCLEQALLDKRITTEERINRARAIRQNTKENIASIEGIQKAIDEGRE